MKKINVADLIPGMITAEDVYTYNNQLIVQKGTELTDKTITRLEFYSIITVRIEEEQPVSKASLQQIAEKEEWPYSKLIQATPEFKEYKANFDELVDDFSQDLNDLVHKNVSINPAEILKKTVGLLDTSTGHVSFFHMLHNMREYDDTTFAHSMNVALLCNVLATWLDFSPEEIDLATLCGLFHDVGKLAIPNDIIKKPDKLTDAEYKIVKTHTLEGYNVLKDQDLNEHIKNAALMHHERFDGSGYPSGVKEDKIDIYAQLVAIADVYEAMTAARVYRGPLCPFKVIEIFEKEGFQKYNPLFVLTFLENVVLTYINNRVRLNNGVEGDVVFINKHHLSKPLVRFRDNFIDLSQHSDLFIEAIL